MPRTGAKRGLTGVNVGVDSTDARQFHAITGQDKFHPVMAGIDAAFDAPVSKGEVNTVLMRDVNHHQLDTFLARIRPRPFSYASLNLWRRARSDLFRKHHISGRVLRDELIKRGWILSSSAGSDGPAQVFVIPITPVRIGLIVPYEKISAPPVTACVFRPSVAAFMCLFGDGGVVTRYIYRMT